MFRSIPCAARFLVKQIIGVDRLDYSKGLPGRMQPLARLLEKHPNTSGR
jgi:trehalose-6-phosphate synthase